MGEGARRCAREVGASSLEYALLIGLIAGGLTLGAGVAGNRADDVFLCTGIASGDTCVQGVTIARSHMPASCLTGAGRDRCERDLMRIRRAARKAGLLPSLFSKPRGGLALTRR